MLQPQRSILGVEARSQGTTRTKQGALFPVGPLHCHAAGTCTCPPRDVQLGGNQGSGSTDHDGGYSQVGVDSYNMSGGTPRRGVWGVGAETSDMGHVGMVGCMIYVVVCVL